ncbi:hypothetical protein FDN13_01685 [Caloramator sp. E03]|uniref:hypothetical protein n=1 Tax=Caloramator sp. E03 TaxID=2576307 RepID=UPI001110649B|nr:hypothetical protein [Caloramator sp. E03]QCX32511.1 hypothetical protein FDN13_01685 [Caloramator sp. E03]
MIWLLDAGKSMGRALIEFFNIFLFKNVIDIDIKDKKLKRSQRIINKINNINYIYENSSNRKISIGVLIDTICMELLKELIVKIINRTINIINIIDSSMVNFKVIHVYFKLKSSIVGYIDLCKNNIKNIFKNLYIIPTHGVISNSVIIFEFITEFFKKFSGYLIEKTKNSYDIYVGIVVRG